MESRLLLEADIWRGVLFRTTGLQGNKAAGCKQQNRQGHRDEGGPRRRGHGAHSHGGCSCRPREKHKGRFDRLDGGAPPLHEECNVPTDHCFDRCFKRKASPACGGCCWDQRFLCDTQQPHSFESCESSRSLRLLVLEKLCGVSVLLFNRLHPIGSSQLVRQESLNHKLFRLRLYRAIWNHRLVRCARQCKTI